MKESVLQLFQQYPHLALAISLCLNVLIALAGVLPSFFLTAANILFFGFWQGTLISFLGEALGAALAFVLYRKGLQQSSQDKLRQFSKLQRLITAKDKEAFLLVVSLRLLPFVPSGLITFAAAIGEASFLTFFTASSLGKAPALLIEAYSVYQVTRFNRQGKLILMAAALFFLFIALRSIRKKV